MAMVRGVAQRLARAANPAVLSQRVVARAMSGKYGGETRDIDYRFGAVLTFGCACGL